MPAALPYSKHTPGRTFIIAISVLGLVALTQVGVLGWAAPLDGGLVNPCTAGGIMSCETRSCERRRGADHLGRRPPETTKGRPGGRPFEVGLSAETQCTPPGLGLDGGNCLMAFSNSPPATSDCWMSLRLNLSYSASDSSFAI